MRDAESAEDRKLRAGTREDILIWLALLALLAATYGVTFIHWEPWNTAISFVISGFKAALVAYFYMHLRRDRGMTRIFALAGTFWLAILFTLTLSDYLSRDWLPYPSRWPVMVDLRPAMRETRPPVGAGSRRTMPSGFFEDLDVTPPPGEGPAE